MSLAPNSIASWPIFKPCVTQLLWMLGMLSRYNRETACVFRYSNDPDGADVRHVGVVGLERPADERGEATRFVLQFAQPLEMFDPFGQASRRDRTSSSPC